MLCVCFFFVLTSSIQKPKFLNLAGWWLIDHGFQWYEIVGVLSCYRQFAQSLVFCDVGVLVCWVMAGLNAPPPDSHIFLNDGEQKLSYKLDTKMPDSGTFIVLKEDHTLGNMIRMQLLRDERVLFAGYRMPHPLEHVMHIKV